MSSGLREGPLTRVKRLTATPVEDLDLRRTLTWRRLKGRRLGPAAAELKALAEGPFRPALRR